MERHELKICASGLINLFLMVIPYFKIINHKLNLNQKLISLSLHLEYCLCLLYNF
jgi:hypothetical protein